MSSNGSSLAPPGGLEPPTCGLEVRRSIQLSYRGEGQVCPRRAYPFERVKGIEPSPPAWKAGALPLSYTRGTRHSTVPVGLVGLEPTTSCSQSKRATKLRHSPLIGSGYFAPNSCPTPFVSSNHGGGDRFYDRIASWDYMSRWERSELGKDLRRLGLSYGEIMDLISVKKSTLATWCRDVMLSEEQYRAIRNRTGSREGIPRDTNRKRRQQIAEIRERARRRVPILIDDPLWVAGTMLYWAEGAKTPGSLSVANADPRALRLSSLGCGHISGRTLSSLCIFTFMREMTNHRRVLIG